MKIKSIILLALIFIAINVSTYYLTQVNQSKIIDIALKENLNTLDTHYKVLLESQKNLATAVYKSTIQVMSKVIPIMAEAKDSSKERQAELRDELHKLLALKYKIFRETGVLQCHFVFSNNVSFYRAHKPSKFGDDLTGVRLDFEYVNTTQKPIRGFTQGRTTHGFRNAFPLFDKNNEHIGVMEVSFSSESFQKYLNDISKIHSHFLVNKKIFETNAWSGEDLILHYTQSSENENYMLNVGKAHKKEICVDDNSIKLQAIKKEINTKMLQDKAFSTYTQYNGNIEMISFLPIPDLNNKVVAWIVSYTKSNLIKSTLSNTLVVRVVGFLLSLLIIYYMVKQIYDKQNLENKTDEQNVLLSLFDEGDSVLFKWNNDINWSVNYVSNNVEKLLGYTESDFLDKKIEYAQCIHSDDLQRVIEEVKLGNTNTSVAFEHKPYRIITKQNEIKWIKDVCIVIKNANNDVTHYVGQISDITQMKHKQDAAEKKAYIDGLTGVNNRNKFDEIFEEELKSTKRYNSPLSIAIIDIDKFKNFNDTFGHLIGDEVLITMAQTVKKSVRESDVFARWGGEEFTVLFKNTSASTAEEVSQKLKDKIQENEHPTAGKITASFGVTEYKEGDTLESIFNRCDDALYLAKENGRNRVEVL